MSEEGIQADPARIEAVQNWEVPKNKKQVRQSLCFARYYRQFMKGFAETAWPLNDLLVGHYNNPQTKEKLKGIKKPVFFMD